MEEWTSLYGIVINGDNYEISNYGNVKSIDRYVTNSLGVTKFLKGKILSKGNHTGGYHVVNLMLNGKSKNHYVHILVAKSFISNPENKSEVNHKDGNKKNNHMFNLEWTTPKENTNHARKNGLCNQNGEKSVMATLTNEIASNIRKEYESGKFTQREISKIFNIDYRKINQIVNYKTYVFHK